MNIYIYINDIYIFPDYSLYYRYLHFTIIDLTLQSFRKHCVLFYLTTGSSNQLIKNLNLLTMLTNPNF